MVFKTSDRHPTATFRLRYLDTPLSVKFLEKSIEEIAKLMRVSADRIAIREEFYTQSQKDLTNDDPNDVPTSTTTSVRGCEGFTKVEYIVFPEPTNAEAFTPMALIARLEERRLELKQVLDLLDVEYKIEGYELIPDVPSFIGQPVLGSVTDLNAEIEGILLDSPGYIYICVEVERDTSIPVPSAT